MEEKSILMVSYEACFEFKLFLHVQTMKERSVFVSVLRARNKYYISRFCRQNLPERLLSKGGGGL
jgi:hypothetical protein